MTTMTGILSRWRDDSPVTAHKLYYGYRTGIFPRAELQTEAQSRRICWHSPELRAVIPLGAYTPPRSLRQVIKKNLFEIRVDTAFEAVMRGCQTERAPDADLWISEELIWAYTHLHRQGAAHSIEAYQHGQLVGGLYGVAIGGAFFGESMFHRVANASKVAFDFLITRLRTQGFTLLDTQYLNDNVRRFGALEISRADYLQQLEPALDLPIYFTPQ